MYIQRFLNVSMYGVHEKEKSNISFCLTLMMSHISDCIRTVNRRKRFLVARLYSASFNSDDAGDEITSSWCFGSIATEEHSFQVDICVCSITQYTTTIIRI